MFSKKNIIKGLHIAIQKENITPERGSILDRNGKLLVYNQSKYHIDVIPIQINNKLNINKLCNLLEIDKKFFYNQIEKSILYSAYTKSRFISNISEKQKNNIEKKIYQHYNIFFKIKCHFFRAYNIRSMSSVIGYISEVDKQTMNKHKSEYHLGDFAGKSGIEKSYESYLKGKKGSKYWIKNIQGLITNKYHKNKYDIKENPGHNLYLSIDWNIQNYAERLMYKKKGSIVILNPDNGEIIAITSSPILDANIFINNNYEEIKNIATECHDNILMNKATQGIYPPGSPFKILTELAGLEMGVVDNNTSFICQHGFRHGKMKINCHCGLFFQNVNLENAIAKSCNNYFIQVYKKIIEKYPKNINKSIDEWNSIMKSFGLGRYLHHDLATESKGLIPDSKYYNKKYHKRWNALTILSNSIGQGEINVTPLQLANVIAVVANKGYFFIPHIIKETNNIRLNKIYKKKMYVKINKKHFDDIILGMKQVFINGTAKRLQIKNINLAGKTGTVQNFVIIKNKILPLKDHSVFTLFGPIEKPKIVIMVIIENSGYGSKWAGPIASLLAEKYFNKKIIRKNLENEIMNSDLESNYKNILILKNELNK